MLDLLSSIIAIIMAVSVHEFSHAWMATKLGDPTARAYGRLTLNPLRHIDIFGSIIVPLILILSHVGIVVGWAKPVPSNPENLRNPKRDSALIALAGPFSNFLTALIFAIPLKYLSDTPFVSFPVFYDLIRNIYAISIVLIAVNILPFPPFDGSKIIGLLIPRRYQHIYDEYLRNGVKYVIVFVLFDVMVLGKLTGFSILHFVVEGMATWVNVLISLGT